MWNKNLNLESYLTFLSSTWTDFLEHISETKIHIENYNINLLEELENENLNFLFENVDDFNYINEHLEIAEISSFVLARAVITSEISSNLIIFLKNIDKTSFFIANSQLLGLYLIDANSSSKIWLSLNVYYEIFIHYYNIFIPHITDNDYFDYYIFQSSFYLHGNISAIIQMYYYWIEIFDRVQKMILEITYLSINLPLPNIYFDNYSKTVQNSYETFQYTNSFGQRYNIQWDWEDYVPWFFDIDHQNFNSWKKLNSSILQPRRFSLDMFQLLYVGSSCNDIYTFEDALELYEKKLTAKIKFRGYRKNIYLLNNMVPELYLKHRDYIQGPSYVFGNWWYNFENNVHDLTSYRQKGLIFYWYEHFYSIEIPLKCFYAYWYQIILPQWWWSLYFTDGYLSGQSWQSITKFIYFSYKKLYSFYINDEKDYKEDGSRVTERTVEEEFSYLYQKILWSFEPDFESNNSDINKLEQKKYEEFLDLKTLIDPTKISSTTNVNDFISSANF